MTDEYWLQKKTLGGWSMVTWYSDLHQAFENYERCLVSGAGYSWRLVKVETLEQKLLDEVTDIQAPEMDWNAPVKKPNGWGTLSVANGSGGGLPMVKTSGWGGIPSSSAVEHGMSGKVWLIHHGFKKRLRADPEAAKALLAGGEWERGGPKTAFK